VDNLSVDIENPGVPNIVNLPVDTADEEISFTFPNNTKRFRMKVRGGDAKLKISFQEGTSQTVYFTNEMGNIFESGDIDPQYPYTIYFSCSKANKIVEVLSWANLA
jgi:hypothetical protein